MRTALPRATGVFNLLWVPLCGYQAAVCEWFSSSMMSTITKRPDRREVAPLKKSCARCSKCIALTFALALVLAFSVHRVAADENAHGTGVSASTQNTSIHQPGPAVSAQRTSKRYTAQGMTVNPVAIDFDNQGNIYVVEGWRMGKGAAAIVHAPMVKSNSLPLDLQRTTIQERAEHIEWLIKEGYFEREYFTGRADLLRLVKDSDGDGTADQSSIFAGGFNDKLDGVAAGVLYLDGKVLFACVPNLWLLEDRDGDGDADKDTPGERTSLFYGFGLRWGYGGHDLHGLTKGPDGRIYFTMADRGYNIQTQEGERLIGTNVGSVFRMWPDGSGLEIFATGLRNPQELAFDNDGNLFTGENNCDAGDLARFCYIPEGSDAGWRQDVQSMPTRGVWLREHMWEPRFDKNDPAQPAWIMPPLANVGRGPSGIAHYPGTGDVFPKNGSFLMCDYPAGVRHVLVKPDGASFTVVEDSKLSTTSESISDVAWGYDGRLYLSDWGGGWGPNDKYGHLKVMVNEKAHAQQAEAIAEVKALFANGFDMLSEEKLIELLGHADQRVRTEAQWELAGRDSNEGLLLEWLGGKSELSRLHALWALGMQERGVPSDDKHKGMYIDEFFEQPDCFDYPRLVAQAYAVLGDLNIRGARAEFLSALKPSHPTASSPYFPIVQHQAAIALGKVGTAEDIPALFDLLARNDNTDVVLRHAASYGLSLIGDAEAIHNEMKHRGSAARLGGVLALRHLKSPLLINYIEDKNIQVAAEAVRAIYDQRLDGQLPQLAALADDLPTERMIEPIMRRVIEANVQLANPASADRLAKIAANADAPEQWRALAVKELTNWSATRNREDVRGRWLPRKPQPMDHAIAAMDKHLPAIKQSATGEVLTQARVFELTHILKAGSEELAASARQADEPTAIRLASMQLLAKQNRKAAIELGQQLLALEQTPRSMRSELRAMLNRLDWSAGLTAYLDALDNGTIPEQQEAIHALAPNRSGQAQGKMAELGKALTDGTLAPELRLDAYLALTRYNNLPPKAMQAARDYAQQNTQPGEAPFIREAALAGGSIERGREVFLHQETASCVRCHRMDNKAAAGPRLSNIGAQHDIGYLYYALVKPNRDIAKGFATSAVTLRDGQIKSGRIVKAKSDAKVLVLTNADGVESKIPRDQIVGSPATSRQSLMPAMTDKLSQAELRDVLAYLASLQGGPGEAGGGPIGPSMVRDASGISHAVWLTAVLLAIAGGLGLILVGTVVGGTTRP